MKFFDYIIQVVLIVFSVVLGLFLSEKISDRNDQKRFLELEQVILSEVKDNQKLLREWYPYHREVSDDFKKLLDDEAFLNSFIENKDALLNTLMTKGTYMNRPLTDDAWSIVRSNELVSRMEYDKMLGLSKVYKQQDLTFAALEDFFDLYNISGLNQKSRAKDNLNQLEDLLNETVGREQLLLEYYEKAIDLFE